MRNTQKQITIANFIVDAKTMIGRDLTDCEIKIITQLKKTAIEKIDFLITEAHSCGFRAIHIFRK